MRKQWYPIHDPELGTCTIVAPRTGTMLVSATDYRQQQLPSVLGFLLGASLRTRGRDALHQAGILDSAVQVGSVDPDPVAVAIRGLAALCLRILPLSSAIRLMRLLFRQRRTAAIDLDEAVRRTAAAFGRRSKQDCLLVSLCRHVYLRRCGIPSKIILGVQVPTEKMHAWVQIGEHPMLECPDVLVHYQACVAYF